MTDKLAGLIIPMKISSEFIISILSFYFKETTTEAYIT